MYELKDAEVNKILWLQPGQRQACRRPLRRDLNLQPMEGGSQAQGPFRRLLFAVRLEQGFDAADDTPHEKHHSGYTSQEIGHLFEMAFPQTPLRQINAKDQDEQQTIKQHLG